MSIQYWSYLEKSRDGLGENGSPTLDLLAGRALAAFLNHVGEGLEARFVRNVDELFEKAYIAVYQFQVMAEQQLQRRVPLSLDLLPDFQNFLSSLSLSMFSLKMPIRSCGGKLKAGTSAKEKLDLRL